MLKRNSSSHFQSPNKRQHVRAARSKPRASQACQACASAKAKCDNRVQCKRCVQRNIACIRVHPILDDSMESEILLDSRIYNQPPLGKSPLIAESQSLKKALPLENHFSASNPRMLNSIEATVTTYDETQILSSYPTVSDNSSINLFDAVTDPSRSLGEWDLTTTYNLFDLGNDMDYSFLPSIEGLPAEEGAAPPSPRTSLISGMAKSTSDVIFKAFRKSAGRWNPKPQHYRAVEEPYLSLGRMPSGKLDSLGKCDPYILSQSLPPGIRDQILCLIAKSCENDNFVQVVSTFPTVEVLDRLLKSFFTQHKAPEESWIHIHTFQPMEARLELLIACIAAAAVMSPSRPMQKFGLAIHEFLNFQLWVVSEKSNVLIRDLQFLQAFALHVEVGLWSGVRRKMEMSGSFIGILTNSLRGGNHYCHVSYSDPTPTVEDENEVLEAKWRHWVREESFKRLIYHTYIHCSQETLMTSVTSTISYSELLVPLPQARRLWYAKSALEWKTIYFQLGGAIRVQPPCLIDLLVEPRKSKTLPKLYDQHIAQLCSFYAVSSMVRRYGQDKAIFAAHGCSSTRVNVLSDEAQHQQFLHMLNEIRSSCDYGESLHSLELDLIYGLISMHLFAPFDQMELVAGKEGQTEAERVYPALHRWVETQHARQAVWHASQVIRAMRKLSSDRLINFYAVASYQASLCLWVYGVLSQEIHDITSPSLDKSEILLDNEESIKSQRWITHNRGIPVLSGKLKEQDSNGEDHYSVPIRSTTAIINTILHSVLSKFAWKVSPLVENINLLMRALGDVFQRAERENEE